MISSVEKSILLNSFLNDPELSPPLEKCIHEIVDQVASTQPDEIAVVHEHEKISYKELADKSSQLANILR